MPSVHRRMLIVCLIFGGALFAFVQYKSIFTYIQRLQARPQHAVRACEGFPSPQRRERTYQLHNFDRLKACESMENPKNNSCSASVLILTPLMDAAMYLKGYFRTLSQLSYPKELISLGFLVSTVTKDSQQDPTLQTLRSHISSLPIRPSYKRITIIHQASEATDFKHDERHAFEYQKARRKELARCRNILLTSALMDEAWVLWLDVDVIHYSPSLLLELMQLDKDIVVPNCFRFEPAWPKARRVPYDRNNWYETTESMAHQRTLDPSDILFEGYEQYHPTFRQSMTDLDLYTPRLVPLDGVGGTFTLVKAAVHRSGVIFPIEPVDHEIETEGMAKWAKRLGFSVFGIPHLSVLHA